MPRAGRPKVRRYSLEFKLKAVKLSQLPGVEVQAVADALEIHPFMLSRWRKEARDGVLRGRVALPKAVKMPPASQVRRLQALQRKYAVLRRSCHPKKIITVHSARKPMSSRHEETGTVGVTRLCRLFAATRAGFYGGVVP